MRLKYTLLAGFLICSLLAQAQKDFKTSPNGLKYKIYTHVKGKKAVVGDVIRFHFVLRTDKDSVLSSTYNSGIPVVTPVRASTYGGDLSEGFQMLAVGDSGTFLVSADSFYDGQKMPVKSGSVLAITIKMLKISSSLEYAQEMQKKQESMAKKMNDRKAAEPALIEQYVKDKCPNAIKTASGLYYIIETDGAGPHPAAGQTVVTHYTGKLLNGATFDSDKDNTFSFTLGEQQVIAGWDEGFALLKKGSKAKFIIPSSLAYGEQGANGMILPYTPLVFEVELVDIK